MWDFISRIVNQLIAQDPDAAQKLSALEGKYIQIEVSDLPLYTLIHIVNEQIAIIPNGDSFVNSFGNTLGNSFKAHTTLRGPMAAYLALLLSKNMQAAIKKGLVIEGDLDAGQIFRNLAMNLDIDWEEWLSHYTGDVVANGIGQFIRIAKQKKKTFFESLSLNISEYIQEERYFLPRKEEVDQFINGVDELKHQVDRLEAKMQHLKGTHFP